MPTLAERWDRFYLQTATLPLDQKVFFTENLRVMIKAGLSMSEALNTLAAQAESKLMRRIIGDIRTDVESGKLLSQGMKKYPKIFEDIFVSMIQIGEVSGTLEQVLMELTTQMKKDYNLRSKVKGAMTYPIVILVAMLGITAGLVTFVLPKLLGIFKEFGAANLPLPTRILMWVTDFAQAHGLLIVIAFIVFVVAFIWFLSTKIGKSLFDLVVLRAPIIAPIAKKVNLARFCRTISGLLHTDIPVVQAFDVTSQVLSNVHYKKAVQDTAERIKKGETIAKSLGNYGLLFPPLVIQMIYVGERSGNVDELMAQIADFYEQQVDQVLDSLSSIIEPVLILFLGGMVGGIALSVMMPLYALTQSVAEGN